MAKIKLGARPKTFTRTVTFDMLEGGKGSIACVFKYRTRKQFGEFIDEILKAGGVQTSVPGEQFSMTELMEKTSGANGDYIMAVLEGWNLDEDLTKANAQWLADELPGAANAIMETYRAALVEGRLGN
jgi:hypothetical protein